jgi:electron transfer flavoprotein-quinone oxidoreductase
MADDKFTAIIVGAGPAGSTAAMTLAREGCDVLLIEKGPTPGAKNMFGGRMYCHVLNRLIPEFWEQAPVERAVVSENITFLNEGRSASLSCRNEDWAKPPFHSFTLLRAEFDAWLAEKAEEAGAMLACNICVDDLLYDNGKVAGIRAGEDEMFADVVIAADGANSILAQKAGLAELFSASQVATGAKMVVELPPDTIDQRFQLSGNQGAAMLFVGDCTNGMQGGGFLYTNKSTVSLGLVINTACLQRSDRKMPDLVEDFRNGPHIAPLLEGGEVVEYSAHLVPEAGIRMTPQLFGDGILIAGDAAGLVLNLGFIVRGMDFAAASGEAAAMAVLEAKRSGDFSRSGLSIYRKLLEESFVLRDLEFYSKVPQFMENRRLYEKYPGLVTLVMSDLFTVDGRQPQRVLKKGLAAMKKSGVSLGGLAADCWKGAFSL